MSSWLAVGAEARLTIGVLAMQGAFYKHRLAVEALGAEGIELRLPHQLDLCDGVIIPGGESTTIAKQIDFNGFRQPLEQFAQDKPIFGTCAGMILLARSLACASVPTLGVMDIHVERNAYGRQTESFATDLHLPDGEGFHAVFIRAPQVLTYGDGVQVLGHCEGRPVLVQQGYHLAASFHPELTDDRRIHAYFLQLCRQALGQSHALSGRE